MPPDSAAGTVVVDGMAAERAQGNLASVAWRRRVLFGALMTILGERRFANPTHP